MIKKTKDMPLGDHSAFEKRHIPVLFFTTGMHDDYHKTTDDPQYINFTAMLTLKDFLMKFIDGL